MAALRELQAAFAAAVFGDGCQATALLSYCTGDVGRAARGLAAYRRSVLANLASAVRGSYPVLEAIVGKDFLAAAAHAYALARPSISGDLNAYGGDFDRFLAAYPPAATLPYLPAVAQLEWQVQQVYAAADAAPQDLSLLAATAPDYWGELGFDLDPAHACLASDWPIGHIWTINQPDYAGDFRVDFTEAQTVLIQRRPAGIVVEALKPGEPALLHALAAGACLADAVAAAAGDAGFDLPSALQRFIRNGLLRRAHAPSVETPS